MAPSSLGGRIPELLETLKGEFDTLTQDVGAYHRQKDDVEHKCTDTLSLIFYSEGLDLHLIHI